MIFFLAIPAGVTIGCSAVAVFNRIPANWLCDYGEEPCDLLKSGCVRLNPFPWAWVFSVFFSCMALIFANPVPLVSLWAMLIIAISDKKYMIIPDQFVALLAFTAIFSANYLESLYGCLLGGGCMLTIGITGKLLYKRDALGFGDVKLFAAIGLITGPYGTALILAASSFLSCLVFSIGLLSKRIARTDVLPLGPYIAIAYFFHELFKSTIWLNTFSLSVVSFSSAM